MKFRFGLYSRSLGFDHYKNKAAFRWKFVAFWPVECLGPVFWRHLVGPEDVNSGSQIFVV
jgi:hypothetical protein